MRVITAMRIGYARVSTADQHLDLQQDALRHADCEKIVVDRVSGTVADRPGLARVRDMLRPGDMLVVWRLDRLGRSIKDLIEWVTSLEQDGIGFQSLHEAIDTSSPSGKLTFHLFAALAEFERHLIQERTQAGLAAARARGRKGGRPKALQADQRHLVVTLYHEKKLPVKTICAMMGISKPTLYAYVRAELDERTPRRSHHDIRGAPRPRPCHAPAPRAGGVSHAAAPVQPG